MPVFDEQPQRQVLSLNDQFMHETEETETNPLKMSKSQSHRQLNEKTQLPSNLIQANTSSNVLQKIKDQNEVLMAMQEQLDTYMFKSFPSLG